MAVLYKAVTARDNNFTLRETRVSGSSRYRRSHFPTIPYSDTCHEIEQARIQQWPLRSILHILSSPMPTLQKLHQPSLQRKCSTNLYTSAPPLRTPPHKTPAQSAANSVFARKRNSADSRSLSHYQQRRSGSQAYTKFLKMRRSTKYMCPCTECGWATCGRSCA